MMNRNRRKKASILWIALLFAIMLWGCSYGRFKEFLGLSGETEKAAGRETQAGETKETPPLPGYTEVPANGWGGASLKGGSLSGNVAGTYQGLKALAGHPGDVVWCSYGDSITVQSLWQETVNSELGWKEYSVCGVWGASLADKQSVYWWADENGAYYNVVLDSVTPPENGTVHEGWFCSDDRIGTMIPGDADLVLVMGGTNDMTFDVPLGSADTIEDDTTSCGGLAATLRKIREHVPDAVIVVAGPPALHPGENGLGFTMEDYADAMEEVCRLEGIPYVDVYHDSGITLENASRYSKDLIHPNGEGAELIARCVADTLKRFSAMP